MFWDLLNTFVVQIVIEFVISLYIWIIRFLWASRHEWTSVSNNETWSMIISDDKAENFHKKTRKLFSKWFTYKSCYKFSMESFFVVSTHRHHSERTLEMVVHVIDLSLLLRHKNIFRALLTNFADIFNWLDFFFTLLQTDLSWIVWTEKRKRMKPAKACNESN